MNYLLIFSLLSLFSFFAIIGLFFWKIKKARLNPELYEAAERKAADPFFGDYSERMRILTKNFIKRIAFHPSVLRIAEILIRRVRILVLKAENFLFGLIDYLNGRRRIHKEKEATPSPFLEELNNSKRGQPDKNSPA